MLSSSQKCWSECSICRYEFNNTHRKAKMICMQQHSACQQCIEEMFKGKNKLTEQAKCHTCRCPVKFSNITTFHYLQELIEIKEKLQHQSIFLQKYKIRLNLEKKGLQQYLQRHGSQRRRFKNAKDLNNKQLQDQLIKQKIKQKEKNEWLVQLCNRNNSNDPNLIQNTKEHLSSQFYKTIRTQIMHYERISQQQTTEIKSLKQIIIKQNQKMNSIIFSVLNKSEANNREINVQNILTPRSTNNRFTGQCRERLINNPEKNQMMTTKKRLRIRPTEISPTSREKRQKATSISTPKSIHKQKPSRFTPERLRATNNNQSDHTLNRSLVFYPCAKFENPFKQ